MVYTIIWVLLGAVGAATELVALVNRRPGDTLSEHVWKVAKVADPRPTPVVWVIRGLIALVMLWLAGHLSMGWWTPSNPGPVPW